MSTSRAEEAQQHPERSAPWRLYGAAWWHLLALVLCLALTALAVSKLLGDTAVLVRIVVWFVGAALAWDLVAGPLLAAADHGLRPLHRVRLRGVAALNYVRVPGLLSLLLLVVWWPLVRQRSEGVYRVKTGLLQDGYLGRWAAVTAVLVVGSALLYALAVVRAGRRARAVPVAT